MKLLYFLIAVALCSNTALESAGKGLSPSAKVARDDLKNAKKIERTLERMLKDAHMTREEYNRICATFESDSEGEEEDSDGDGSMISSTMQTLKRARTGPASDEKDEGEDEAAAFQQCGKCPKFITAATARQEHTGEALGWPLKRHIMKCKTHGRRDGFTENAAEKIFKDLTGRDFIRKPRPSRS
jgi:hypothetical protein